MDTRSPATPNTPYGQPSQYKVNVNRQKTRKWVEAKTQNYDGDDWGGYDGELDDGDDQDAAASGNGRQDYFNQPQQAQRPGRLTAGLRAISNSGPPTPASGSAGSSPSLRPSERIALEKQAAGNRSASGPPALHIQTPNRTQTLPPQQVAGPPGLTTTATGAAAPSPFPPRKSSMTSQDRPDLTTTGDGRPSRTSSRPESPASAARSPASATGPPRFIRPSEIYRRMEEEKEKERRSMESAGRPSLDSIGGRSSEDGVGGGGDATNAQRRQSFGRNDEGEANRGLRPLDTVAERKSEYGFDGLMINPAEPAPPPPPPITEASSSNNNQSQNQDQDLAESRNASVPQRKPSPSPSPSPSPKPKPPTPSETQPQPQPPELHHPQATNATEAQAEPVKRYSTSPKLPLLSRLSGFGGDFFSGGMGFSSDSPKSSERAMDTSPTRTGDGNASASHAENDSQSSSQQQQSVASTQAKPFRPSFPGAWVSETATTPGEMPTPGSNIVTTPGEVPSISESPEDAQLKPAPLRTPSPGSASAFSAHEKPSTGSGRASPANNHYLQAAPGRPAVRDDPTQDTPQEQDAQDKAGPRRDMTPIAPLQPRKKGSFVEETPAQPTNPITRVDTVSTAENASPLKESDVLRDEIMRSLSPVRPSDGPSEQTSRDESEARESAYLSDVYGDYWSGEDKTPEVEIPLKQLESREVEATPSAKDDAANATPKPPAQATFDPVTTDAAPPPIPAVEPETTRPEPRRERFSWEAASTPGGASPAETSPIKLSTAESAETLTSPVTAARQEDPTSPSSPLLSLPNMNFDSDISPQVASASTTLSPGQDAFSPPPGEGASKLLYPTEDKMLVQSPMTPLSPMEPIPVAYDEDPQRTTSPPHEPPEGVPLPRSPSPTQGGPSGDDANRRQSQTAYNMMSLKQILQLPTSSNRVQKMQETREHLAVLETGLASWLADMAARPAHENAMPSYGYALSGDDAELWGTKGGAVRIPLNAPPPEGVVVGGEDGGAGGPGGVGRTPSTSLNMGNLVHHSGQAGAKGKELLQSAGKMGKGLLSKGKNKLRERAESKRG